jgi:3-dehydroquinate dehydratase type I
VELAADPTWRRELWAHRGRAGIILSWHDFSGTPETARLEAVLQEMLAQQAEIIKLVTMALVPEDSLRLLSLIPKARAAGREIIAFAMGPAGQWSRVVAPLLGSFLTFAPFTKNRASAPGQLTVNEVRRFWKLLQK